MSEEQKEEEEGDRKGAHSDNNLSKVHQVMKDNDLPFYHSTEKSQDKEEESD